VVLEITQEVNDVDETTTSDIDSPTITQRSITTTVAVRSGETVVLGGLIRENESESEAGVPGLRSIPGIGRLFSSRTTISRRTELLVLITPTAISNTAEAREITLEMKKKMSGIDFTRFQATAISEKDGR
jgi:general secretion pathway protein D